jgi:hypothetical protein
MSGLRLELLDDVAAYLLVAPLVASVGMVLAVALWLLRSRPRLQGMRVGSRRRARW